MYSCEASFFDRTLCFCHSTGIMHTYVCELPGGHEGDHAGRGDGCSRASWTNDQEESVSIGQPTGRWPDGNRLGEASGKDRRDGRPLRTVNRPSLCRHENVGQAEDGSGVVVCWDCDEQFTPDSAIRSKLDDMTLHDDTGDPSDEGYMNAVNEMREHFVGA